MKKLILFIFTIGFSLFFVNARGLKALDAEGLEITENGKESVATYVTEDNIQISVMVESSSDSEMYRYGFDIVNLSDEEFKFRENTISIYQGSFENDDWREIRFQNPTKYYEDKQTELAVESVFTAIAIGAAIIDGFTPHYYGHRYYHYVPPVHHHAGDILFGLGIAGIFSQIEDQNNLDYLKDNLLFSTVIKPGDEYSGFIYVPKGRGPDYLVEIDISKNETAEFYFSRKVSRSSQKKERKKSERKISEEDELLDILEPKITVNDDKLGFVFSAGIPFENTFGFGGYAIYATTGLGFYVGFDTYSSMFVNSIGEVDFGRSKRVKLDRHSGTYYFGSTQESTREYGCFNAGVTLAAFPEVSLMLGIGLDFWDTYYYGDIRTGDDIYYTTGWVKNTVPSMTVSPQVGLNFVIGPVDLAVLYSYRIGEDYRYNASRLNVMAGFAF